MGISDQSGPSSNDGYGHVAGDVVLREFAQVLRGRLRGIDTLGRWGAEVVSSIPLLRPLAPVIRAHHER